MQFNELVRSSNDTLEQIFRAACTPATEALVGYEWRGCNITPTARLLGIQKFIKGFFREGDRVGGYNIKVQPNSLDEPWIPLPALDQPRRYAFYDVTPVERSSVDNLYPDALFLNYGRSTRNPRFGVERLLRDYLMQPDAGNPNLLLGKAYFAFGSQRVFSNFFVIERL